MAFVRVLAALLGLSYGQNGQECENCDAQGMLQLQPHRPHFTAPGKKFVPNVWAPAYQAESPELVCKGASFLDCFTFFTEADPTHGEVVYVDKQQAEDLGLYKIQDGNVYLGSLVGQNGPAKSIRLQSKNVFSVGNLFVIDVKHMPTSKGTWPAWWSYGPDWPNNGEIDTVETVNIENQSQSTLHTSYGCRMPSVPGIFNQDCNSDDAHNGCGVFAPDGSGGPPFNQQGGGVFATLWTSEGIKMWYWAREDIPHDLAADSPDVSTWGEPYVFFPFGEDCPASHFNQQMLTINLDFCGDWAGNVFPGGLDACNAYVEDPANKQELAEAYWLISYVKVFTASAISS